MNRLKPGEIRISVPRNDLLKLYHLTYAQNSALSEAVC
jgi:hypothetical protein